MGKKEDPAKGEILSSQLPGVHPTKPSRKTHIRPTAADKTLGLGALGCSWGWLRVFLRGKPPEERYVRPILKLGDAILRRPYRVAPPP